MAVNLIRNSRVFFTTNVDSQGRVKAGTIGGVNLKDNAAPFTSSNTYEIQVLEGMTFTQNTTIDTVTLNEAGATPARGQRSFNTALEPLDFSFSTYLRPRVDGSAPSAVITAEEGYLWNAFASSVDIGQGTAAWTNGDADTTPVVPAKLVMTNSNKHQLQTFGLIIVFDDLAYVLDNCALDTATIDFGIDAIATIQWAGKGTQIRQVEVTAGTTVTNGEVSLDGADLGTGADKAKAKNTTAKYIANKLTTVSLGNTIGVFGNDYSIPITGGSITLANNLTYLTPANLGVVNLPITYFAGTRGISGTLTAYLRTGSSNTGGLLSGLLANSANEIDPSYAIKISLGGSTADTRVDLKLPAAMLQIPTVNTEQVISTTISFNAQGSAAGAFSIDQANELEIEYYATA